jgi:ADP-ribose pyrophosphatase YjhB (NUDIX family)
MDYLNLASLMVKWAVDRPARLALRGYRPEVICLIRSTVDPDKYLLIRSQAHKSHWAPPQEGMKLNESIESAVNRCLGAELGIGKARIQYRKSAWIGLRKLPERRWDERELKYSLRGLVGQKRMIGKGYYAALVIADSDTPIESNPAEVYDWAWVNADEYHTRILTNPADKQEILRKAWASVIGPI